MRHLPAILALLGGTGCTGPLSDARYLGRPLLTLKGEILMESPLEEDAADLAITLFWTFQREATTDPSEHLEAITRFPSLYTLHLYLPPDESVFSETREGQRFAAAYPILYLDQDGDGLWTAGVEPVVGSTERTYILYTEDGFLNRDGTTLIFEPGYAGAEFGPCTDGSVPLIPRSTDDVNLHIGDGFFDTLLDLNCDGSLDEWAGLCTDDCGAAR